MAKAKSKERLETELAKAQLEALKVRMNPHFISNALTSIRKMLYHDEKEAAIDYLTKFSKLMRKTLDNASRDFIKLADEIDYIGNYLEIEKLRFGDKFTTQIIVAPELETTTIKVPPTLFQPFIENAINHGLMHRTTGGILTIQFKSAENLLLCTIEDNGVGRERTLELRSNSSLPKVSQSEKITRERLALYNKMYNTTDFSVETIDLEDDDGKAIGTRVEVRLPLNRQNGSSSLQTL